MKLTESQCRACHLSLRCLTAATATLLHKDPAGKPLMDRAFAMLHRVGPDGKNLPELTLTAEETDTLVRALNASHFVFVLTKNPVGVCPEDQRGPVLKDIRDCLGVFAS